MFVREQRNGKLWASTSHSLPSPFLHPGGTSKMQKRQEHVRSGATQWKVVGIHFPLPSLPLPTSRRDLKNAKKTGTCSFGSNAMESCGHPLPTPFPPPSYIPEGPQKCKKDRNMFVREQRNGKLWASTSHSLPSPFLHPGGTSKMQKRQEHVRSGATQWKVVGIHFPLP